MKRLCFSLFYINHIRLLNVALINDLDRQRKEDRDDVPDSVSLVTTFIFDT